MKISLSVILFFFIIISCKAQEPYKNALSVEIGRHGVIINLQYDRQFNNLHSGFRILTGTNFARYLNYKTVGGGVYYLLGNTNKFLELGAELYYLNVNEVSNDQVGFSFVYPNYTFQTFYPAMNLGYRRNGEKTLFRAGVSPAFINTRIIPGGYMSIGRRF